MAVAEALQIGGSWRVGREQTKVGAVDGDEAEPVLRLGAQFRRVGSSRTKALEVAAETLSFCYSCHYPR